MVILVAVPGVVEPAAGVAVFGGEGGVDPGASEAAFGECPAAGVGCARSASVGGVACRGAGASSREPFTRG